MILDQKVYVPTLAIRASEMNGLEFLPGSTKDRITPCVLLAPWANALTLQKAIDRVEKAYRHRNYFLDFDINYEFSNLESNPQKELLDLMNPSNAFENWFFFVKAREWIWPCIQTSGQTERDIRRQILRFQEIGRPYCLRVLRDSFPENFEEIVKGFSSSGSADFAIILEGGWTQDSLSLSIWFDGLIGGSLHAIDAKVPIIVSCTSIPQMFTPFDGGVTSVEFSNRDLVAQIARRRSNRRKIIYGDWGSTRPRGQSTYRSRPFDRVDYPVRNAWNISRNKKENWNYQQAAVAIVGSDQWDGNLGIWGEELIFNTTISPELGINTPQKNVAARINIHIHRQAFYEKGDLSGINLDEDWED